jgi:hypothetical protein
MTMPTSTSTPTKTPPKKPRPTRPAATTPAEPAPVAANLLRAAVLVSTEPTTATVQRLTKRGHDYAATEPGLTETQLLVAAQTVLEVGRLGHVANAQIASAMLAGWLERREREVTGSAA